MPRRALTTVDRFWNGERLLNERERCLLTVVALFLGSLVCLCATSGPARADQAACVLERGCGAGGEAIAPLVREQAHRFLLHPALLAALVAAESTCRPDAINRRTGAVGLGQIIPGRSAAPRLTRAELLEPRTNLAATARHLARCWLLCGVPGAAVAVYGGQRQCRATEWSRRVLGRFVRC
jgi:hypothetical protein